MYNSSQPQGLNSSYYGNQQLQQSSATWPSASGLGTWQQSTVQSNPSQLNGPSLYPGNQFYPPVLSQPTGFSLSGQNSNSSQSQGYAQTQSPPPPPQYHSPPQGNSPPGPLESSSPPAPSQSPPFGYSSPGTYSSQQNSLPRRPSSTYSS